MAENAPDAELGGENFAEIATGLQQQIDDLTSTLESHQRLFEQLRAAGVFPDGERGSA